MNFRTSVIFSLCLLINTVSNSQQPKNGTYIYKVAFSEWDGASMGITVTVIIKGDSVKVIHDGAKLTGAADSIIDRGMLMKHKATGKWIIGHNKKDRFAKEIGGCSDGPSVIDIKRRKFWMC